MLKLLLITITYTNHNDLYTKTLSSSASFPKLIHWFGSGALTRIVGRLRENSAWGSLNTVLLHPRGVSCDTLWAWRETPATVASPESIWNYSPDSRHSRVLAFMASCENPSFCLNFTLLLLGNPNSSSPSRPRPLTEEPPIWFYSIIAPILLLDSLPGLSFAKIILYLFLSSPLFQGCFPLIEETI